MTASNQHASANDDDPWQDLAEELFGVEVGKEHTAEKTPESPLERPAPEPIVPREESRAVEPILHAEPESLFIRARRKNASDAGITARMSASMPLIRKSAVAVRRTCTEPGSRALMRSIWVWLVFSAALAIVDQMASLNFPLATPEEMERESVPAIESLP